MGHAFISPLFGILVLNVTIENSSIYCICTLHYLMFGKEISAYKYSACFWMIPQICASKTNYCMCKPAADKSHERFVTETRSWKTYLVGT